MLSLGSRADGRRRAWLKRLSRNRVLQLELLERRQLLTGASDWYDTVSPNWFRTAESPKVMGDSSSDHQSLSRWVVRLDAEFSASLGDASRSWQVFYPATVLAAGVTPPWAQFRAITGLGLPGQILIESRAPKDQAAVDLAGLAHIDSFDPERTIGGAAVPNDPQFDAQIGLHNTGQTPPGGTDDADIDAPEAWNLQTGSRGVVVAVIDSGIDYTHPDLAANIWTNPGEAGALASNGIDDDLNGFIDDVHGYDFVNNDGDPQDDNGHGTHIAGTIGAVGNNGVGVTGVAWQASLMALKFLDGNLRGTTSDAIKAFNYMTMMKKRAVEPVNIAVSNNSWGFSGGIDVGLRQVVQAAGSAGILTVAAAGNGNALGVGINNDESPFYPASFADTAIISVAASDKNDSLLPLSNFGRTSVDIAAPGAGIVSTLPDSDYGTKTGTSMATAHVSGVAALVFAQHPDATPQEVRDAILQAAEKADRTIPGDKLEGLGLRLSSGGRLNAVGALTAATFAPRATLVSAPNITQVTSNYAVSVRYTDEQGIDLTSISPTNIRLRRIGFSNDVATAKLNPGEVIPSNSGKTVDVVYRFTPIDGTFSAIHAGTYSVDLLANQVVNTIGLAAAASSLGTFQETLTNPRIFIVNTTDDTPWDFFDPDKPIDAQGRISLRSAVSVTGRAEQGSSYVIVLPDGTYRLSLPDTSNGLQYDTALDVLFGRSVEIIGTGTGTTIIDAQGKIRAFGIRDVNPTVNAPTTLTLRSLAIKNGYASDSGGAIFLGREQAVLIVDHCLLTQNEAGERGGAIAATNGSTIRIQSSTLDGNSTTGPLGANYGGGAIFSSSNLTIDSSTISNNVAAGGQLSTGGGGGVLHTSRHTSRQLTVTNSTFSGNTAATTVGGALSIAGVNSFFAATATLTNVTVTQNRATLGDGGGIFVGPNATLAITNSIVAQNESSNRAQTSPDVSGNVIDGGRNLIGVLGSATGFLASDAELHGTVANPVLPEIGPLQDNGGPTLTHDLLAESPAIDRGLFLSPSVDFDQRGKQRPNLLFPDIGAVEKYGQTIRGSKFVDLNHDGIRQLKEPGLSGQVVYVDLNENGRLDLNESSATTGESGAYELRNVPAGNVLVSDLDASGIVRGTPQAIAKTNAPTVQKIADQLTLLPDGSGQRFAGFRPPVIGGDTVVFGDAGNSGGLYAATGAGSISTIAVPGQSLSSGGTLHTIFSYDFDGETVVLSAGSSQGAFENGSVSTLFSGPHDQAASLDPAALRDAVIQADGKFVLAGYTTVAGTRRISLTRYNTDGTVDSTFGVNGVVVSNVVAENQPNYTSRVNIEIQNWDQKLVVTGGTKDGLLAVARYLPSGIPDNQFGASGITKITDFSVGSSLAIGQTDHSIAVGGSNFSGEHIFDINDVGVARILENGTVAWQKRIDIGKSVTGAFYHDSANRVLVQPDGKVLVIGGWGTTFSDTFNSVRANYDHTAAYVLRYDASGNLDSSFSEPDTVFQRTGTDGIVSATKPAGLITNVFGFGPYFPSSGQVPSVIGVANLQGARDIARQSSGAFVVAGDFRTDPQLTRFTSAGSRDTSFGANGSGIIALDFYPQRLIVDAQDRIYVAGNLNNSWLVRRYSANGALDSSFAVAGTLQGPPGASLENLVLNSNQLLICENIGTSTFNDYRVAAFSADGVAGGADQVVLTELDGILVAATGFSGTATGEIGIGNEVVAVRALAPESLQLTALNTLQTSAIAPITAATPNGQATFSAPHVDSATGDIYFVSTALTAPFAFSLEKVGNGDGLQHLTYEFLDQATGSDTLTGVRILDAEDGTLLVSAKEGDGTEGVYLFRRDDSVVRNHSYTVARIAGSRTPVPGGTGNFAELFSHSPLVRGAISNGAVIFDGYDSAVRHGIYVKAGDGPITKVLATGDTLDGKQINSLQLADATALAENNIAFQVQFADGGQAIFVASLSSATGYRVFVKDGAPDAELVFPSQVQSAEIHGVVYDDLNRNGAKDDPEPTIANRTVYIDANRNGLLDTGETFAATDQGGSYFFPNLAPLQSYLVAVIVSQGDLQTAPLSDDGRYFLEPGPGQIVTSINFGLASTTAVGAGTGSKLSGSLFVSANGSGDVLPTASSLPALLQNLLVYVDQNGNGNPDVGEPATVPDSQGHYSFSGLENSNVQIRVARRPGMTQTSPLQSNSFSEKRADLPVKPESAAAGDFDHQPGEELAVTMSKEDAVWIVRPSSTGAITVVQKLKTHDYPGGVAVADLNNDGWADLIVSNAYGNDISIFVNQKNALAPFLITTPLHYPTQNVSRPAGVPQGIAIGDFNGDDLNDIAVANSFSNDVAIFLNETAGQTVKFRLASRPAVGKRPLAVVAGQFAGDSNLDLAIANNGNGTTGSSSVTILQGTGSGTFTSFTTIKVADGPTAIAAGKLNGEFTDLVTANYAANRVTILRGQGGGQFEKEEISAGVGPSSVAIVDVDGDGDRDIAISNGSDAAAKNHLLVIRNQGGGVFNAAEPAGSAQFYPDAAFSVVVGDFDGVLGNDLALVNPILPTGAGSESGQLAVYFNQIASDGSLRVALETPREIAGLDFGLAFPWHNVIKALDVSGDGPIVAGDALDIINFLNAFGAQAVPSNLDSFGPFYDVTADGTVAANDALEVINYINAFGAGGEGEAAVSATLLRAVMDGPSLSSQSRLNDLIALLALDVSSQPKRRNR